MGAPDLPEDNDNSDSLRTTGTNNYPVFVQQITNTASDESDHETDVYNGYQPLNMTDHIPGISEDDDDENSESEETPQIEEEQEPRLISNEVEIEVWNSPRPSELNIELDSTKTQQILSVMAGITLPTSAIPSWAQNMPEEKWKEDLLEKIRDKNKPKKVEN